jgi:hypothetical protein
MSGPSCATAHRFRPRLAGRAALHAVLHEGADFPLMVFGSVRLHDQDLNVVDSAAIRSALGNHSPGLRRQAAPTAGNFPIVTR